MERSHVRPARPVRRRRLAGVLLVVMTLAGCSEPRPGAAPTPPTATSASAAAAASCVTEIDSTSEQGSSWRAIGLPDALRGGFASLGYQAAVFDLNRKACDKVMDDPSLVCPTADMWPASGQSAANTFAGWGARRVEVARAVTFDGPRRWMTRVRLLGDVALGVNAREWVDRCRLTPVACPAGDAVCDAVAFSPEGWSSRDRTKVLAGIRAGAVPG